MSTANRDNEIATIEGGCFVTDYFLNEERMVAICKHLFEGEEMKIGCGLPENKRIMPDVQIPSLKLVFEFDGPRHYTEAKTALRDIEKDGVYQKHGYKVIRFPYFIQPTMADMIKMTELPKTYFKGKDLYFSFLNGFIYPDVPLPADFCELGIQRFRKDMSIFSDKLGQVYASLESKTKDLNHELLVYPVNARDDLFITLTNQDLSQGNLPEDSPSVVNLMHDISQASLALQFWSIYKKSFRKKSIKNPKLARSLINDNYAKMQDLPNGSPKELFFASYQGLGGVSSESQFNRQLQVFVDLTENSFTGDHGPSRELAMLNWTYHVGDRAEAERYFYAVDSVYSYS